MRGFNSILNKRYWILILIFVIPFQSLVDANISKKDENTTRAPDVRTTNNPRNETGDKVRLTSEYSAQGTAQYIKNFTVCTNVQQDLRGKITSLKVNEGCAKFYSHDDCIGPSIEVLASDPFQGNLTKWEHLNLLSSVGPCESVCSLDASRRNVSNSETDVLIFPQNDCQGGPFPLKVEGCKQIPEKLIGPNMSVYPVRACIELYNTNDCRRIAGRSVQLRPGNPHTCELSAWKIQNFQSLSLCSYNCAREGKLDKTMTPTTGATTTPTESVVISLGAPSKPTNQANKSHPSMSENATIIDAIATSEKNTNFDNVTDEIDRLIPRKDSNRKASEEQPPNLYFPFITLVLFIIFGFLVLYMLVLFRIKPITQIPY